jgi:RNA polymerase sigma-70 factor (ECF subfamily)
VVPARQSDRDLVAKTLEGDQQAFGVLVARYRSAVVGVAFHRTGSFEDARDIAQEAFLRAYVKLSELRKPESFASWLYHIADLTALGVARRARREEPLPPDEILPEAPRAPDAAVSDLAEQVHEALATLDEPTRLAVVLHYIDGYSHAEVADFLGTTAGAVRTRVSRAKSRLREEIMSEAGRALKEAAKRVMAAVAAGDYQAALEEVRRSGLPPEQHPDLTYGAGVARVVLAREPFSPRDSLEGAELLMRAWEGGRRDPQTVWLLVATLNDVGEYNRIPPILTRYVEETRDPDERVKAGAYLASAWEMLGDHAAAADAHSAAMDGLGEQADLPAKLDSYVFHPVAVAYAHHGRGVEWLASTLRLWNSAPESVGTLERALSLLCAAEAVAVVDGGERTRQLALQYGEELLRDPRLEDSEDRLTALSTRGRVSAEMLRLYSMNGLPEKAQAALDTAKAAVAELIRETEGRDVDRKAWREAAFVILANAGILCRYLGRKQDALALLGEAEQIAAATSTSSPVFFQLAALILETGGDRQEALHYLRRMTEDRRWACSGFPQKEFLRDPAFEPVRRDDEFLSVIDSLREAAARGQE